MYKRLTTENPTGMLDSILNATIIIDRKIYLRDFEGEGKHKRLCDYIKEQYKEKWDDEFPDAEEEELGDYMDSGELLDVFYHMTVGYSEIRERLKKYEDSGLSPEEVKEYKDKYDGLCK